MTCQSCGRPAVVALPDGSLWCGPCHGSALSLAYDRETGRPLPVVAGPVLVDGPVRRRVRLVTPGTVQADRAAMARFARWRRALRRLVTRTTRPAVAMPTRRRRRT